MKSFPKRALIRFSRNVKNMREAAGLSQEALAEKLDIAPRHYQKIEAATVTPSFGLMIRIKKKLQVSWTDLMDGV